jgi:hypothetical protein
VLQNAVENARSLLGRVDVDDVGRLEMYLVDLVHWWSLILGPDLAVEHGGIGLVGNREGQPGSMIANSIPARLVATRMRVALPRACTCHCYAHAHGHTMRACTRPYHAHAHGYHMHRAEL